MKYKTTIDLKQTKNSTRKAAPAKTVSRTAKPDKSSKKLSRLEIAAIQSKRNRRASGPSRFAGLRNINLSRFHLDASRKHRLKKLAYAFGLGLSVIIIVGGIFLFSYLQRISADLPSPEDPFRDKELASEIFDRNGRSLFKVFNEFNRDSVKIDEVPHTVRWAFLAAEDSDFYDHPGFDPTAILRCGIRYVRDGFASCGGSTITQQTLKITSLYNERGLERKIKEVLMALQVERVNEKDKILQMYLTVAPFGSNLYGLTTGADFYFNKKTADLTLAQSVILASIINDPVRLSPTLSSNPEYGDVKLFERAYYILDQLEAKKDFINNKTKQITAFDEDATKVVKDDIITSELIAAAREELKAASENKSEYFEDPTSTNKLAGHFVNYVMELLQSRPYKDGQEAFTQSDLQTGGYKVYTTLDYNLQQIAEKWTKYGVDNYTKQYGGYNAALMTMVPKTGEILTMVGSKNFNGKREGCKNNTCKFDPQVNVLNTLQSAGSSMKPLGYYIGYSDGVIFPGSALPDIPIEWGSYKAKNVDGRFNGFNGSSTARTQLLDSRNLPALQVIDAIGVDRYVKEAQKFGYSSIKSSNAGLSVILGGTDVIPIEHVQAYGVFANGGDMVQHEAVLKIVDREGNIVYNLKPEKKRVGDPQGIYILNASTNNMYAERNNSISWDGRDVSGKTGTTEGQRDLIMMLYSPDFVTMGWVGNNDNSPMFGNAFGGTAVRPWVVAYMKDIGNTKYLSAKNKFSRPGGIVTGGGPCKSSNTGCTEATGLVSGLMIQGKTPKADQEYHTLKVCDDQPDRLAREIDITTGHAVDKRFIIYKMVKPELQSWLDKYLKNKNKLPTESCNKDRNPGNDNEPWVVLTSPTSGSTAGNTVNVSGNAFTTNTNAGITKVDFFIDNTLVGTANSLPFSQSYNVPAYVDNGTYAFKATAYDSTGATGTTSFNIVVGSSTNSNLQVQSPTSSTNYTGSPIQVTMSYGGPTSISDKQLFVARSGGGFVNVGTFAGNNKLNWTPDNCTAPTTTYQMYIRASAGNTGSMQSNTYTLDVTCP